MVDVIPDPAGGTDDRVVHVPDTATALVFRTTWAGRSDLLVVGPRARASYHVPKDLATCVKVRLRPGAARPVLGVPVSELVDRVVPLADLWGPPGTRLERRLATHDGDDNLVLDRLETAIRNRIEAQSPTEVSRAHLIDVAAGELSTRDTPRLPDLACRLSVSERHLRRLFTDMAGMPPKSFARITRIRHAVTRGAVAATQLAHLAVTTGYYDQSHMTADFRSMMGVSPAAFFEGRLPVPQPC